MGIFSSGGKTAHGEDPNRPWEVSDRERRQIREANERDAKATRERKDRS